MGDTMDTMARDPLMLMLSQDMATMEDMAMDTVLVMDMVDTVMDTMDTMARDPLMLSQDMATMDMDMVVVMVMDMDMVVMVMDTIMARDPLMLSQDMANTAMDMVTDTTDKQYKCFLLTV